ncbi:hypothetical protein M8818_002104 [Zalaria obscura]|uniref:Uncharacterized protein n=1 Tax=Zalaria obscura TaxID=2024903 RepID=A0ACC3SHW7_9PEZI
MGGLGSASPVAGPQNTEDTMAQERQPSPDLPDLSDLADLPTDDTIPEDDSLVIMSDDAGQVYAPPAHLAARFYRNSASRRRTTSATSSRRNSLSSTHSHGSSRSRLGSTCQSHSIAQHLRRASIIESRKARLADRAAHAEQVRLRAALAKAAPRGSASSSEERALAAQVAREKYLAKVAATCAEEVQRAKQKAQEMKLRKMEEEQRARTEMEERLAEADKRRAQYQRNLNARRIRRASSIEKKLAVVEEDADTDPEPEVMSEPNATTVAEIMLDDETAARRIQRAWMIRRRKVVVDAYMDLNLTIEGIRNQTFEELGSLIIKPTVIEATSKILSLLRIQDDTGTPAATTTRTFLSAYLVVTHPTEVLSKRGAQEQDLMAKAREFVVLFESTLSRLAPWNAYTPSTSQLENLSQAHSTYTAAFDAWKAQDSSTLIETMVAQFVELDAIWQTVKDDSRGEVANDYREGIRDSQVILLSKIRKLAGPDRADFLIKKAIRESRRRRVRRRNAAEVRPRVAENVTSSAPTDVDTSALPEVAPQVDGVSSQSQSFSKLFSAIPSNRIITHELALDKDFRIGTSQQSAARDALNRELCDKMRAAFEQGEGTIWTVAMAENIRGKLLHISKEATSMHSTISEVLDPDHVYRQASQNVFSYSKFFVWIASILPKLCAPFRDDEVRKLSEDLQQGTDDMGQMIEKLFRLLHVIDLLSLDYSNYLLMKAAPFLIREAAGYEHRMFARDLDAGAVTLSRTKRWWRNAAVNLLTEADNRRDPAPLPHQIRAAYANVDGLEVKNIYARGLVDLALAQDWNKAVADLPETLALDEHRLRRVSETARAVTTVGAILLTAKNLLKRDARRQWKTEAGRLLEILTSSSSSSGNNATEVSEGAAAGPEIDIPALANDCFRVLEIETAHNLPPATKAALQTAIQRFVSQHSITPSSTQSYTASRFTDPLLKVLHTRLATHILSHVSAASPAERLRNATTASERLAAAGLPEFVGRVGEIVGLLREVKRVDWEAHGGWYEGVAGEVEGGQGVGGGE